MTLETIDAGVELVRDCLASSNCSASALGDVDADGFDDLVLTHSLGSSGCGFGARSAILYGSSTGTVTLDTLGDQPHPSVTRLVEGVANPCISGGGFGQQGDLDGDGITEFGLSGANGEAIVFGRDGERPAIIWLDDMDGSVGFRIPDDLRSGPLNIDGDEFIDLVFEDSSVFAGRERQLDTRGPAFTSIERGPAVLALDWKETVVPNAAGYRIEFGGRLIAELGLEEQNYSFDPLDGEAADIVLSVIDSNDAVLASTFRHVPAFEPLETLSATVYGARLVQISFQGDFHVQRYSRYLVWRDGVPLGRAPDGAYDYVDDTVQPGTTYTYHVTPDYLPQDTLTPATAEQGPVLRRRSETLEVTTPLI